MIFRFAITVTVERLIAIKSPLKAHIFWNKTRSTLVIITIWFLTLVLQLPQFFWFVVHSKPDCADPTKSTFMLMTISRRRKHYTILKTLNSALPIVIVVVPLTLLVALNSLLIYFLRQNNKSLTQLGMTSRNCDNTERKVTKRVLCVIVIYFIFNFPSAVLILWTILEPDRNLAKILYDLPLFIVSTVLVTFSKAINFPLYYCININFRKQLKKLFRDTYSCFTSISFNRNNNSPTKNCWKICESTLTTFHNRTEFEPVERIEKISLM